MRKEISDEPKSFKPWTSVLGRDSRETPAFSKNLKSVETFSSSKPLSDILALHEELQQEFADPILDKNGKKASHTVSY